MIGPLRAFILSRSIPSRASLSRGEPSISTSPGGELDGVFHRELLGEDSRKPLDHEVLRPRSRSGRGSSGRRSGPGDLPTVALVGIRRVVFLDVDVRVGVAAALVVEHQRVAAHARDTTPVARGDLQVAPVRGSTASLETDLETSGPRLGARWMAWHRVMGCPCRRPPPR